LDGIKEEILEFIKMKGDDGSVTYDVAMELFLEKIVCFNDLYVIVSVF
jgi:hypothetical protein